MRGMDPRTAAAFASPSRIALLATLLALGACQRGDPANDPQASASAASVLQNDTPAVVEADARDGADSATGDDAASDAKKSIIRPDIGPAPVETPSPEPLNVTIPFPAKGTSLDAAGREQVDGVLSSPAVTAGGAIVLRGHSDSRGSDKQNLAASRRRAEGVRDYMVAKGIPADRITVIAIGEGRPIAPNRKLDGTEDLEGQSRNRRVEIEVALPFSPEAASQAKPSSSPPS